MTAPESTGKPAGNPAGKPAPGNPAGKPAPSREAISARSWIDLLVVAALSTLGILGFETSFGSYNFLIAGLGGLIVGTAAAVVASWLRLGALVSVLVGIAAYFLVGTPIVMPGLSLFAVLPSLQSLTGLAIGAVFGWADILTLQTPVQAPYYIAVLPYFSAWAVALAGSLLALQWLSRKRTVWRSSLLVVGPALLYLAGILLGTDEPYFAAVRGISFATIALVWLGWRRGRAEVVRNKAAGRLIRSKLAGGAIVVVGAILIGAFGGAVIAPAAENRFVLRETIQPPFDPLQFPSPLAGFRKYTKLLKESELFTVEGLEPGQRLRLATMDSYDGRLWNVASSGTATDASGSFALVGHTIPDPTLATIDESTTLTVSIDEYEDVWVPNAGYPSELVFEDSESADQSDLFRYNSSTGSSVLVSGIKPGYRYTFTTGLQEIPEDSALADVPTANVLLPPVDNVPDVLVAKAIEYAGSATTPIAQLRAIELSLRNNGFLSHGLASDSVPSRAGHGADRMAELFTRTQMIGDEEQYASAFALMARHLGYPARVVMGFAPEVEDGQDSVTVFGEDVTAWVEVPFEGIGWLPFFPTPEETDIPQDQVPKPQNEPQPQVRQPPRIDEDNEDLLTPVAIDDSENDDEGLLFSLPGWVYVVAAIVLIPAALYFIPFFIVAALKARRKRKRRKAAADRSVAGAWEELSDRYSELGFEVPRKRTRSQVARALEQQFAEQQLPVADDASLESLAAQIDRDVFSGAAVDSAVAADRWDETEARIKAVQKSTGWLRRQLSRFRIRATRDWSAITPKAREAS